MTRPEPSRSRAWPGAFTLIETMVVISVVAVLIGLLAPALAAARAQASAGVSLSNLRGVGVTFELHLQAHRDAWPFRRTDEWMRTNPDTPTRTFLTDDPWALRYAWPTLMHEIAPWREHYQTWVNPGAGREAGEPWLSKNAGRGAALAWPSYEYSNSFVARPSVWSGGVAPAPEAGLNPTHGFEVAHPSAKALAFDAHVEYWTGRSAPDRRGVLLVDGAAAIRPDAAARDPVTNALRAGPARLYHDTALGVLGRDF